MIRRRPQPTPSSLPTRPSAYEKTGKDNDGIPFSRISVGVIATLFVLLLLVTADFLDSTHSLEPHYEPNNYVKPRNATVLNHGGNVQSIQQEKRYSSGPPPNSNQSNVEIPYIRYEPMNFEAIKERMDYASSHGDADNPNNPNNTIGQHLLDFGIIGFPKCATSTMMRWLNMHDQIAVVDKEIMSLQKQHPVRILRFIFNQLPEGQYRRGYKSPNDIENDRVRNKLRIHYPETRLLVGLRHPVLWFESFYNHRIQNGRDMPNLAEELAKKNAENTIKNTRDGRWNGANIVRANFHTALVKYGKTPLLSLENHNNNKDYEKYYSTGYKKEDEWKLFSKKDQRILKEEVNKTATVISPNPIFLYDVGQLLLPPTHGQAGNDEEKRSQQHYKEFVLSLQEFLGVPKNASAMPTMIRQKPGRTEGINATEQARLDGLKIDMCDDQYALPRKWLMEIGANVAEWITRYLAKSPHGVYFGGGTNKDGSSRFLEIIESYGRDPCPERRSKNQVK